MSKVKKTITVFLIVFFGIGVVLAVTDLKYLIIGFPTPVPSNRIPKKELEKKMISALQGDGEASLSIVRHFDLAYNDLDNVKFWDEIGAENDNSESQYILAYNFLDINKDQILKIRGLFWLYKVAVIDYRDSEAWLERIGYSLKTAQPPADNLFSDNYAILSETELAECKTGALRGNRKAAWLLGKYYSEIQIDDELSEYWYRIGAQNGNPECQYILSQIMITKKDELDQIRGRFWLDRAIKNGYKYTQR